MAINWTEAQKNEKSFWEKIYIKDNTDSIYSKTNSVGWKKFAIHVMERNKIKLDDLNNKTILDLGSGPGGVAKGIYELLKNNEISNVKIIAVDPLMDFYKNEIGILKEDENLKLLTNKGESIDINDETIDLIFSTNVLDHCDNPQKLIDESYRILKKDGIFFPSLHLVYSYLGPISGLIKYFDTNHPHHFTCKKIQRKLRERFEEIDTVNKYSIKHDQRNFTFKNIFKSKDYLRSLKRFISNYVLYTSYFRCIKK